ncbi:DUF2231 domain-containing protein [Pedococcus sp. 5OH_020]|uniref:DUF2231 domain-containing protein n=1 Tax=Pedococcus sp. 5OH_020 TaxID=2989814 RepID=UPI0022E99D1D|nr:DUF2231 domain-containing protein [Pedococcus sp. 5OH_020]
MTVSTAEQLPDSTPTSSTDAPALVRLVHRLESAASLDRLTPVLRALSRPVRSPAVIRVLTGEFAGHALHPALTDLPLGLWTSSALLDLRGRDADRPASRRLLGAGIVTAVPTALTGLAEWGGTSRPESRVASLHGLLNSVALVLYAASWAARPRAHGTGVRLSLAATALSGVSGFLGGHLTVARKTGSRHAAYVEDGVGPQLSRGDTPVVA